MASLQLVEQARSGDSQALVELAVGGQESGARGYSKSREEPRQAAIEGLQAARDNGDKKAQAFALYASLRLRVLQGERVGSCQAEAMEATRLLKELGEKKHAATMLLMLANNSLSSGFDQKPSAALRYASDAFGLFDDASDKAAALTTQAEAHIAAKNPGEAVAVAAKALLLLQGNAPMEASTMILTAKAQLMNKEFVQAETSATSAIAKAGPDHALVASAKCVVAESMFARGQQGNGREVAVEGLELARAGQDIMAEASLLHLLAKSSLSSDPLESVDYAEKALTIYLLRGEPTLEAAATHTAAKAHLAIKNYDAALQLSMQASSLGNGNGDVVMEASALHTASQARMGKGRIGEALLAARKSAELFHAIGDKDGEKTVAIAITKIQDKMPPPHRPQNVLLTSNPASAPTNLITQARHCVVWNNPCKEGAYINYNLELLRLIDDISKSTTQTPIVVCSMGAMGRHLGCPVPGQQKDINSMSIWGVVRTVRLEMPRMPIFTVDLPTDADGSELARVICDATQDSGPRSEVAYSKVAGDGQALLAKMGRDTQ